MPPAIRGLVTTVQMQTKLDLSALVFSCGIVLFLKHSSLLLVSGPEFHEEWLRDGPCDATTTGLSNSGSGVNSLPVCGEHEIRGA
jgi:hypothetical protein